MATSNDLPSNQKGENPDIEGNPPAALSGAKYGALSSVMRMKEAKTAEVSSLLPLYMHGVSIHCCVVYRMTSALLCATFLKPPKC